MAPLARSVLLLSRDTEFRVGDAMALRWDAVTGQPPEALRLRQEKTGEPLGPSLSVAARAVLEALPREGGHVFPARGGGPRLVTTFRRTFYLACRAAGVEGKKTHDVRRTFATVAWNAGVSPAIVAATLRQRTTRLVSRYTHAEVETLRRAAEAGAAVSRSVSCFLVSDSGNMRNDAEAAGGTEGSEPPSEQEA